MFASPEKSSRTASFSWVLSTSSCQDLGCREVDPAVCMALQDRSNGVRVVHTSAQLREVSVVIHANN
jgi:hypothetical protein